ncbi:hypothetical protein C8J57DRAFT_1716572 [Mycena rebaudengoi]|nr:hypothetical protein C8J57DRAFT_1716572 [Mycena rebaudengoi]
MSLTSRSGLPLPLLATFDFEAHTTHPADIPSLLKLDLKEKNSCNWLPPVAVTATAVDSTAVFLLPEALTGRDGRRDGRRGRLDG